MNEYIEMNNIMCPMIDGPNDLISEFSYKNTWGHKFTLQEVTIWAYPTSPGKFDDHLVCCIRENPEPVLFKVSCYGVRADLELDRKQLHFDKMILHRSVFIKVTLCI